MGSPTGHLQVASDWILMGHMYRVSDADTCIGWQWICGHRRLQGSSESRHQCHKSQSVGQSLYISDWRKQMRKSRSFTKIAKNSGETGKLNIRLYLRTFAIAAVWNLYGCRKEKERSRKSEQPHTWNKQNNFKLSIAAVVRIT